MRQRGPAFVLAGLILLSGSFLITDSTVATSWSVVPPLLAISMAFLTGHLAWSLGSAVVVGAYLIERGEKPQGLGGLTETATRTLDYAWGSLANSTNLLILGFVFFVLSMVHVINRCRGFESLVVALRGWVIGPRSAQFVTALLGCSIFIDDYANTMVVGTTMKRVTDRFGVSREKLAFLVDATSAPIAGIALVSTWIGYEVGLFSEMSEQFSWPVDGYGVFLQGLSFRFYCYFMILFVFVNILFGVEFGPMKRTRLVSKPLGDEDLPGRAEAGRGLLCALLPIALLLFGVFSLLWWDGGGLTNGLSLLSAQDWRQVLTASENGTAILFCAALASYVLAVILAVGLARLSWVSLRKCFVEGLISAGLPVGILILAWSMKVLCDDFKTGEWVVTHLASEISQAWLPMGVFVIAALTAFATGTSWGTMAILIPTVTPLALALGGGEYGTYVALCLAAILDGAIMGDHCSPISDTTIMSCISTDCDLLSHVRTQLPYSLMVGSMALIFGYLPSGFALAGHQSSSMSLGLTLLLTLAFLVAFFWLLKHLQSGSRRTA